MLPALGADGPKPTRQAFLAEVLDARPTAVTSRFDDYTPGSYHIEKEDLVQGLTDEAKKRKLKLGAVSILGPLPFDPLWTSYVLVFIQEGEKVRVNSLIMPHARITGKATGLITTGEYRKWLEGLLNAGVLRKAASVAGAGGKKGTPGPFASHVLLVTWSEDGRSREVLHGNAGEDARAEKLAEHYNGLLGQLKQTYPEGEE